MPRVERFGREKDYRVVKIPGRWKPGEFPATLEPIEFGSFFVSYTVTVENHEGRNRVLGGG